MIILMQQAGIWKRIEQQKPVFIEPKNKTEFGTAMENFYDRVDSGSGAVFAAVCRGKVIIITGIYRAQDCPGATNALRGKVKASEHWALLYRPSGRSLCSHPHPYNIQMTHKATTIQHIASTCTTNHTLCHPLSRHLTAINQSLLQHNVTVPELIPVYRQSACR